MECKTYLLLLVVVIVFTEGFCFNGCVSCWPTDRPGDGEGHVSGEIRRHPEGRSGFGVRWRLQTPPHWDSTLRRPVIFLWALFNKHPLIPHPSPCLYALFLDRCCSPTLWTSHLSSVSSSCQFLLWHGPNINCIFNDTVPKYTSSFKFGRIKRMSYCL